MIFDFISSYIIFKKNTNLNVKGQMTKCLRKKGKYFHDLGVEKYFSWKTKE